MNRINKKRRITKQHYSLIECTIDGGAPADRDDSATDETDDIIESEHSTHTNKEELGAEDPDSHLYINPDDDISYNDILGQDSPLSRNNHLSDDGDLSESDNEYSRGRNSISNCFSDDTFMSEGSIFATTNTSNVEHSENEEEQTLAFSDQLENNKCTSIKSCDPILEQQQIHSTIGTSYDIGSIRGRVSSRSGAVEWTESKLKKTSHSCLGNVDKTTTNKYADSTMNHNPVTTFVHSIDSTAQYSGPQTRQVMRASLRKQNIQAPVQNSAEEKNNSYDECEVQSAAKLEITSLHGLVDVAKLGINTYSRHLLQRTCSLPSEERTVCGLKNAHVAGEDDHRIGHDKLNNIFLESNIGLAPSGSLSANERIKMRISMSPSFVRTLPVRRILRTKSDQAKNLIQCFANETRKKKIIFRNKRKLKQKKSRIIVIPPNHPCKILWNVFTILLTFISAYTTHTSIRDRRYEFTAFAVFTEAWFVLDILLNFITAHQHSDGTVICSGSAVWARYLTTWFPIDALALVPWEGMYLRPIILKQNKRNIIAKLFFRSKATVKVTRILRGRHFKIFSRVVNRTKKIGVGGRRLLTLMIKYIPKYILFYRNMKAVLVLKVLRQIHFGRKVAKSLTNIPLKSEEYEDEKSVCDDDNDLQLDKAYDVVEYVLQDNDDATHDNLPCDMKKLRPHE